MTENTQLETNYVSIMLINGMEIWGELVTFYKPNPEDKDGNPVGIDLPTFMIVANPITIIKSISQNNSMKFDFFKFDMASKNKVFDFNVQNIITWSELNDEKVDGKSSFVDEYKVAVNRYYEDGRIEVPEKKILLNE